jgi:hypothetical protein
MNPPRSVRLAFRGQSSKDLKEKAAQFKKRATASHTAPKKAKKARVVSPSRATKDTNSTASLATPRPASPPPPPKAKKSVTPSRSSLPAGDKKKTSQPEDGEMGEGHQHTESMRNLATLARRMKSVQNWDQGDPPRGYGAFAQ